jgi:glutaredoxin
MGYGPIVDEGAEAAGNTPVKVVLYTALGCPFCPLIEQRLEDLRRQMGFTLEKIDVTLRPDLLAAKGIRSVPVVEVGARLLFGLVTTKELAAAIAGK